MSHNTKAIIKSLGIMALGSASIYIYGEMVTDYVIDKIESYFEQ